MKYLFNTVNLFNKTKNLREIYKAIQILEFFKIRIIGILSVIKVIDYLL